MELQPCPGPRASPPLHRPSAVAASCNTPEMPTERIWPRWGAYCLPAFAWGPLGAWQAGVPVCMQHPVFAASILALLCQAVPLQCWLVYIFQSWVVCCLQGHSSFGAAMKAWYSEESSYRYGSDGGRGAGHFTQIVGPDACGSLRPRDAPSEPAMLRERVCLHLQHWPYVAAC